MEIKNQPKLFELQDPEMSKFDKERCLVKRIGYRTASRIVNNYHYAHRTPSIVLSFGLYVDKVLAGVITYGVSPVRNVHLCCGEEYVDNSLELNRLFVFDWAGRNSESYLIGQSFKIMERDYKKYFILVSYADSGHNHTGYIYQATNWIYTGKTKGQAELKIYGKVYHKKNSYNVFGTSSLDGLADMGRSVEVLEQGDKYRYVYFLGSKSQKKKMRELLKWPILPYPKGDIPAPLPQESESKA